MVAEPGVLSKLSSPLADQGISIFQFSTYESDFTLVPEDRLQDAIDVLRPLFMMTRRSYTILRETEERRQSSSGGSSSII
jgi:SpoU rRNA methylase family enzyme